MLSTRPRPLGRALPVTRSSLRRAGERRCGSNSGRDDEEERRALLRIHNSAPHDPSSHPFSLSSPLIFLSFPPAERSALHSRSLFRMTFFLFSTFSPALLSSIYVPVSPSACAPLHSTRAYRIAINGFRFRCLNLCILLAFRSIRSFLQ